MGPRARSKLYVLPPDVTREALESIAQHDRGESVELTPDEMERWHKTGHLPERAQHWVASRK
jgi:hypothetical protein